MSHCDECFGLCNAMVRKCVSRRSQKAAVNKDELSALKNVDGRASERVRLSLLPKCTVRYACTRNEPACEAVKVQTDAKK
jgi:hypothetical protein